jgi:hypothetical protein
MLDIDEIYDAAYWQQRLLEVVAGKYKQMLRGVHQLVESLVGFRFDLVDADTQKLLKVAAQQVVRIDETTRNAIQERLLAGYTNGARTEDIAASIDELFTETWRNRSYTIARTELQTASLKSQADRYRASGVIKRKQIIDGTDWDDACKSRNGKIVPVEDDVNLNHPNCLIGGQLVLAPNVLAATTRKYEGEVIVLRTAADDLLACTPNHPVLTDRGWLAACLVHEGQYVVCCRDGERMGALIDPNHDHTPALIEQVANALGPTGGGTSSAVPLTSVDFHGDAANGDICVVNTNGLAEGDGQVRPLSQPGGKLSVIFADADSLELAALSMLEFLGFAASRASDGCMCGGRIGLPDFRRRVNIAQLTRLFDRAGLPAPAPPRREQAGGLDAGFDSQGHSGLTGEIALIEGAVPGIVGCLDTQTDFANGQAMAVEALAKDLFADADNAANVRQALAGLIEFVRVEEITQRSWRGHVYNLQTKQGWYAANDIITHNCTVSTTPILEDEE